MGLYDVPKGITPESGILISTRGTNSLADGASEGQNHGFGGLGQDYVVGVHGWGYSTAPYTLSAEFYTVEVLSEPDLVAPVALPDNRVIFLVSNFTNLTTSGGFIVEEAKQLMLPAPVLTVKDWSSVANNEIGAAGHWMSQLFYSIYRVDSDTFVRLAGISLSRGS